MKGKENKSMAGVQSTDFLVCFPTRAHLTLMPKPICSPARSSDPPKRRHNNHYHNHHHHHLKGISTTPRGGVGSGQASRPLAWSKKNKQPSPESSEPTSPKVTCAGQVKVKYRGDRPDTTCRNWQSVMEEVERIHNRSKSKKRSSWVGPLGFKKEVVNFLTCLRSIKFDLRCFGSFPDPEITSDDDEEHEEDEDDEVFKDMGDQVSDNHDHDQGSAVFSKWFMVLQDNQEISNTNYINNNDKVNEESLENYENVPEVVPPPNALLLMRCRSAPAKNRVKQSVVGGETEESQMKESEKVKEDEEIKKRKKKRRASLAIVMKYDTEFYKMDDYYVDEDIAQETWIVGELKDHLLSRSRSWRK